MAAENVVATPTKRFFVHMLTRDIELVDAILDLLDNCIDGIVRQPGFDPNADQPYKNYWAKITATHGLFELTDNCGGIPRKIAQENAFRLGRTAAANEKLATVGLYGIGMKRALFKMGKHSTVTSQPDGRAYVVDISADWLADDAAWTLQMEDAPQNLAENGTRISIRDLYETISYQFNPERSEFLDTLTSEISKLYALIINKGFRITLNGQEIPAIDLKILVSKSFFVADGAVPSIEPFVYRLRNDNLSIDLVVGFYRSLATEQELDSERQQPRTRDDAGWTIICNDRVVLHNDKTFRTGWGRNTVPGYHNQFISIAGVVSFKSTDPWILPLNTTKRGLDADNLIFIQTLEVMMEGLKKFTDFTNKWKGREKDTKKAFEATDAVAPMDAIATVSALQTGSWTSVRKTGGQKRSPNLPLPERNDRLRRISFRRSKEEIVFLADRILGDEDAKPADVGLRCWEDRLKHERGS